MLLEESEARRRAGFSSAALKPGRQPGKPAEEGLTSRGAAVLPCSPRCSSSAGRLRLRRPWPRCTRLGSACDPPGQGRRRPPVPSRANPGGLSQPVLRPEPELSPWSC